jgi:hypothetical protein
MESKEPVNTHSCSDVRTPVPNGAPRAAGERSGAEVHQALSRGTRRHGGAPGSERGGALWRLGEGGYEPPDEGGGKGRRDTGLCHR